MASSELLFSPAPRTRDSGLPQVRCSARWHAPYAPIEVEQFDGSWRVEGCHTCRWEAMYNTPRDQQSHVDAVAELKAAALNRRLIGTGITPRFRSSTFETFETGKSPRQAEALALCREYAEDFEQHLRVGRGLLLLGNVGTGKTHLACAIVQHVVRNFEAYAVRTCASDICRVVRGSFGKGAGYTDSDVFDELAGPDLLVIDEIGVQSASDFAPGVLSDVIDRRYQHLRPTILVSNRKSLELAQFIGERAVDRMRQGGGRVVGFHWESVRGEV